MHVLNSIRFISLCELTFGWLSKSLQREWVVSPWFDSASSRLFRSDYPFTSSEFSSARSIPAQAITSFGWEVEVRALSDVRYWKTEPKVRWRFAKFGNKLTGNKKNSIYPFQMLCTIKKDLIILFNLHVISSIVERAENEVLHSVYRCFFQMMF